MFSIFDGKTNNTTKPGHIKEQFAGSFPLKNVGNVFIATLFSYVNRILAGIYL